MTFTTYLLLGLAAMILKFAFALIASNRSADAKERLKKTWTAWGFLIGILCWPIEVAHFVYVLLRAFLSAMIEAA